MIFALSLMVFWMLFLLTIVREYRRTTSFTLISVMSMGNAVYSAATPILFHYTPESTVAFESYVLDAGTTIRELGLIRVILAAAMFQLVCLWVSYSGRKKGGESRANIIDSKALQRAAIAMGWILVLFGIAGVIWMGLVFNGHLWGLYEISYLDRFALARENSQPSFLLTLGMYGAAQLIVVYLLSGRATLATLILIAMTLHGVGMKSKFPIFWVLIVFMGVAIGQRARIFRLLLPIGLSASVLATMSILRGVDNMSELPGYINNYWDLLGAAAATPWENDMPGPAAMLYYVINSKVDFTVEPVLEALKLLIPKVIFDRGAVLSDVWAEKMLRSQYEPGLSFGWSPICDGFLLAGWAGVGFVAFVFARLARYIDQLRASGDERLRQFFIIVCYSSVPSFFYGMRESMGGLLKQMLIVAVLVWLPTLYLYRSNRLLKSEYGR